MHIGISYNLKNDFDEFVSGLPDDRFEELDDIGTVQDIEAVLHFGQQSGHGQCFRKLPDIVFPVQQLIRISDNAPGILMHVATQ